MEFQLTRTDRIEKDGSYEEEIVVLAESANYQESNQDYVVESALPTTNNEWEIAIAYCTSGRCVGWLPWAIAGSVFMSLFISVMIFIIFMQKQRHADAIAEKSQLMVEAAKRAARNERELNDFIAHEVRNPISAALSACSFVSASVSETEPLVDVEARDRVRDDVRIIESSLKYANDLLHSMLDLNRGNTEITIHSLPTDIKRDILEPVASMIFHRDETFEVTVECCPDSLIVSVDRLRLKQIVLNLARNSSRYVHTGGFIRLKARSFVGADSSTGIFISVEDSGPGVPPEKREMLFKKYQKSLDELNQGAGIGLSLCKKLIDFMDGTISLDDTYHSGVTGLPGAKFDVRLKCDLIKFKMGILVEETGPNSATSLQSDETPNEELFETMVVLPPDPPLPEHLTVLFVDDDMVLRKLFARSLRRIRPNWTIRECASGEATLALVESEGCSAFDLIFLDQYMASVDKQLLGTETARLLRSKGVTSIICGLSANDMHDSFQAAGADYFMTKPFPFEPSALRRAIAGLLKGPRRLTSS